MTKAARAALAVGDRVRFRGYIYWPAVSAWTIQTIALKGIIKRISDNGDVSLLTDALKSKESMECRVFIDQCKRLIPKPRREWAGEWMKIAYGPAGTAHNRRLVFVPYGLEGEHDHLAGREATLREVRRGK